MDTKWFKEQMKNRHITQNDVAELIGRERSAVSKVITNIVPMDIQYAETFSKLFDLPIITILQHAYPDKDIKNPSDIFDSIGLNEKLKEAGLVTAPIVGYVQAGRFGETNELFGEGDDVVFVSKRFSNAFGLIVRGDSMNLKYAEGTKLICVPILDYEGEINPGRSVIVMAKSQADEIETTVKEFYTDTDGNHWLIPRSSNPIYQNYQLPNGKDINVTINGRKIKEITITAIVVSSQQDEE